jgi:hypothetical protein
MQSNHDKPKKEQTEKNGKSITSIPKQSSEEIRRYDNFVKFQVVKI